MRLLWLAEDCRAAGLKVVEMAGWQQRGAEFPDLPDTVICHHTGTPASARGDLPTRRILVDGRSDLPGPLCQVGLGRSGTVYTVASGKANHAGKGAWKGTTASVRTIGIEAENPGDGKPWPPVQMAAYATLAAVLLRGLGQTAERAAGHREWALPKGRKTDPTFDMDAFRTSVRAELTRLSGKTGPPQQSEEDVMASLDEVRKVVAEELAKAVKTLHDDHVVLLRGTSTGSHPYNLTSIGKAVGADQSGNQP